MLSHFIIIIGANPKVAFEIEQMIGAEKGCRGDAVLLHFYSPESGNRRQSGEFHRERANESSTERANAQKPSGSSGPSGRPAAFFRRCNRDEIDTDLVEKAALMR